jgi:hypothetical protein
VDRHDRQSRLADVGVSGQARIAAATVEVQADGLAGEVAARYLAGSGVGCLRVRDGRLAAAAASIDPAVRIELSASAAAPEPASTDETTGFRDPSALAVALGAREALRTLRGLLEGRS